ncbi:Hypothetical_protein [Hexamita inflata]|uniref:Hypothetical_protein n=1 Tax=Hexamita inflata TaxID=28002 RepID=A0AA86NXU3_9EUKA|nr:Hypothetical protein HINF_LOCUS15673 [Hexamita inflata]
MNCDEIIEKIKQYLDKQHSMNFKEIIYQIQCVDVLIFDMVSQQVDEIRDLTTMLKISSENELFKPLLQLRRKLVNQILVPQNIQIFTKFDLQMILSFSYQPSIAHWGQNLIHFFDSNPLINSVFSFPLQTLLINLKICLDQKIINHFQQKMQLITKILIGYANGDQSNLGYVVQDTSKKINEIIEQMSKTYLSQQTKATFLNAKPLAAPKIFSAKTRAGKRFQKNK